VPKVSATHVGILLIVGSVSLYAGMKQWVETRNFNPVHVSFTLQTGDVVEQEFSVNYAADYTAYFNTSPHPWSVELNDDEAHARFKLEIRDASGKQIPTYWWDGTVSEDLSSHARLRPGVYFAKLVVLNGAQFLSAYQPEFNIETDSDFPDTLLVLSTWIATLALATGLMLVLRRALVSRQEKLAEEKSFTAPPTSSYPSEMFSRRVRSCGDTRQSLWQTYSNWAVHIVFVLLLPFVVMFVLSSLRLTPHGIWVKLLQQSSQGDQKQSTTVKVVLQIAVPQDLSCRDTMDVDRQEFMVRAMRDYGNREGNGVPIIDD
jgi:hypothetical protein